MARLFNRWRLSELLMSDEDDGPLAPIVALAIAAFLVVAAAACRIVWG